MRKTIISSSLPFPVINNYLLFPTPSSARQISLDVRYIADTHLPISNLRDATSVDVDIVTDEIYWTNRLEAKIYKAPMRGNQAPVEVINVNLITPESIAIDWISRNIYWVDSGTRRVEVATLNGTSRRVLFSVNVVLPTSIAVDLQTQWDCSWIFLTCDHHVLSCDHHVNDMWLSCDI